jgi:hypothetical protein
MNVRKSAAMAPTAAPAMVPGAGCLACETALTTRLVLEVLGVNGPIGVGKVTRVREPEEEVVRDGCGGAGEEERFGEVIVVAGEG